MADTPTICSINLSRAKGTRKEPVASGSVVVVEQLGCTDDAHAGDWHRQVSFLALESIEKARALGLEVNEGDFAENFTTAGIDLLTLPIGTVVRLGDEVEVMISQIGKVCHTRCAIYYLAGDCIFPKEGIFAVVLKGGTVNVGDSLEILKEGTGFCPYSPQEAIDEVEAARAAGTL